MIYFIIKTSHLVNANADCAKVYCKNVEDLIKSSSFFKLKIVKSPKFSSRTEECMLCSWILILYSILLENILNKCVSIYLQE